jgi:hypothetical protein
MFDALPDWIDKEAWRGFTEMRRLKKKPMTSMAVTRTLKALERLREAGEDANLVLNQSEDQGYTGVFPVSESYRKQRGLSMNAEQQFIARHTDKSWAD